jgi:DNA adenine methylase
MTLVDSPIKWVGGKSKLRSEVIRRLPKDAECYAEVFAGAGWVLFGKTPHPVEVLNDKNGELCNLYRVLKWRPAELLEEVQSLLYSREMFLDLRDNEPPAYDELSRAVRFYALIQMAFGAELSRSRNASFGFRNKSRGDLFLNKSIHQIFPAAERLSNVFVENLDFTDLLRRYDQPRTIFFCDPPYLDTEGYEEAFGLNDHEQLSSTLRGIEGRFLLTVNDHPCIREFYAGCRIEPYEEARAKARASEGRQAAACLFISNYDPFDGGLFGGEV